MSEHMTEEMVVIGSATLYLGDCRQILYRLPKIDAIITDPPYGISHETSFGASWDKTQIANDENTHARDEIIAWAGAVPWVVFGSYKAPAPANFKGCVIWDKGPAFGTGDLKFPWKPSFEAAYISKGPWEGRRDEGVLRGPPVVSWESKGRVHPHQKPVWLFEHFLSKLPGAKTILDPFMGSGTVGVACSSLGREFIGIEIDPGYFEIACERIRAAQSQKRLFA